MQNTKYFLHGGYIGNYLESGIIAKFIKDCGCKSILYIGFHYTGGVENRSILKESIAGDTECTIYEKGTASGIIEKLDSFDGVYVSGGNEQELLGTFDEDGFREPFLRWLRSGRAKVYIGSSAGAQVLGKRYFSWESEVEDWETIRDNGLGIFENALFEVHVTERSRRPLIDKVIRDEDSVEYVFGIDEGSAIVLEKGNESNPEIIGGGVYIYKK